MPNNDDNDSNDQDLFRRAVSGSRRLRADKIHPYRQRIAPVPRQRQYDDQAVLQESLAPLSFDTEIDLDNEAEFARSGVQQRVMRKLRRGQFSIEAELDLHRMTTDQAYEALTQFIQRCQAQDKRCVRIVHGKGLRSANQKAVLKYKVNHWLRHWDNVLAFCTARRCDGGSGALYVLLRRS